MQLREARTSDANGLTRLLDQLGYPGSEEFMTDRIRVLSEHPDAGILVCEVQSELAGFLAYQFFVQIGLSGAFCRITYFCVDSTFRGRGVGRLLETKLVSMAAQRGCDRIELHCGIQRRDSHVFYKHMGYRESPKYFTKSLRSSEPDDTDSSLCS
ncbi:MAG: GNAT family N-acetyltransferase [Kiritimatiellia bacterium]